MAARIRREDYALTKHDQAFSKWEILVGPLDWKNYSSEKDGVARYRIHNLPISCSCPGVYELGIATTNEDLGRKIRKLDPNCIIAVYIGQADNVRTRLQHYGRVGSHLDHGNSISLSNESEGLCFQRGPGLFTEIFARGFPIVFRWAPMKNKDEAQKTEAKLLGVFDYAWNKEGNRSRRPNDILLKLDNFVSGTTLFPFQTWKAWALRRKRVGIRINAGMPSREDGSSTCSDPESDPCYQLLKLPLAQRSRSFNEDYITCGVALGDGSVCRCKPIAGRKRCGEHKGKRINGSISSDPESDPCYQLLKLPLAQRSRSFNEDYIICGVALGDGSVCRCKPIAGRKRCGEHKGKRINGSISRVTITRQEDCFETGQSQNVCGLGLEDGTICRELSVHGRKRCELHKGRRIKSC